jgi:coatomer protein complex subunit gamma
VSVIVQPSGEGLTEDFIIRVDSLDVAAGSQPVYVSFTRDNPNEYTLGSFSCLLKFVSKEVDPSSGLPEETGYDDEYQLEEVELSAGGDYIVPSYCSFESEWTKLQGEAEVEEEFSLGSMASIKGGYTLLRSHFYHTHSFLFSGN